MALILNKFKKKKKKKNICEKYQKYYSAKYK
jgi:hypothetical protein